MVSDSSEFAHAMPSDRYKQALVNEIGALVVRAKAGDVRAFEAIMAIYEGRVLRTALGLLGHLQDAQDAAQEVFLRLYKFLPRIDENRDLRPWIYRVTVNVCRTIARKKRQTASVALDEVPESNFANPPQVEQVVELAERREIMQEALKSLSKRERTALVLRDIEGLSTKEVARILGTMETTVRSQVSRARVKIKRICEEKR